MTPAQIAASLTPAQVRVLRNPMGCDFREFCEFAVMEAETKTKMIEAEEYLPLTDLGRAVLAELENHHD